jgi:hypothetical protein
MAIVLSLLGVFYEILGFYGIRTRRRAAGGVLVAIGGCMVSLGLVVLFNIHP